MTTAYSYVKSLTVLVLLALPLQAEDWPQWRGPHFDGSTSETNLPETWSTTKNVAWVAEVAGDGFSTPITCGNRVFVNVQDPNMTLFAMCLDRTNGKVLWKHNMGQGYTYRNQNAATSPSPVTDGKNVFFMFGTGDLAGFTVEGKPLWHWSVTERHGDFQILWKYGSSPLLYHGKLYVLVIHGDEKNGDPDESYILAIDPQTGKELWNVARHTPAQYEGKQAYTTIIPWQGPTGTQLLISGANHVTSHDPETGQELWRTDTYNPDNIKYGRTISSCTLINGMVFTAAPRGLKMYATQIRTEKSDTAIPWDWSYPAHSPDVCTALAYQNKLFVLDGVKKTLLCFHPQTGEVLGQCEIGGTANFWASPTGADGKIYTINKKGVVTILSAQDTPKILSQIDMQADNLGSSLAVSRGQLFIRVKDKLYCIGQDTQAPPSPPSVGGNLKVSKFSIGGNVFKAKASITVTPTGKDLSHIDFIVTSPDGKETVAHTSECTHGQACDATFAFNRTAAKYISIKLINTQGQVIAKERRQVK